MKTIITLSAGIIFSLNVFSQAPNWLWANQVGASGLEGAGGAAVDGSGNCYITGRFFSPSITIGSTTLTEGDMYLVKYDVSGNVIWVTGAGGTGSADGASIAVDASGNIYVAGSFSGSTLIFDTDTLTNATPGGPEIYIAKFDASGNALWAEHAGGTGTDAARSIAVDGSGNSYITGSFNSMTGITFGSTTLTNAGQEDMFIAKFDAAGNALWAKSAGGSGSDIGSSICVDGSGNCYITGGFQSTSITFGSTTLTTADGNLFVVKYNSSGTVQWASGGIAGPQDIAVDGSGNTYICGNFSGSATFGSTTLTGAGNTDMFIAKYNSSGSAVWATGAGGTSYEAFNSIWVDGSGNIYVNGYFQSLSITLGSTTLTAVGSSDVFVAKYSSAGNVLWAKGGGGTGTDLVYSLAVDGSGTSYSLGVYLNSSTVFGSTTLPNAGSYDVFIAKLSGVVGVHELNEDENNIFLFPNPATSEITVQSGKHALSEVEGFKVQSVEVFDMVGQRMIEDLTLNPSPNGEELRVDVSSLASGIYFVKVRGEKQERVAKFVKQ
jgi:hypothetical protein